ncbi:MAG: hypothetical protein NT131_03770 [Methanomassiliicoccales archaeon]|nr:hypothetical protein [Methanomassiliicoccales archaeon]
MANCKKCDNSLDAIQVDETPKLTVKGLEVGINDLDDIMKQVYALRLQEPQLDHELLEEVNRRDHVPPSIEKEYLLAQVQEYGRRFG